MFDTAKIPKNIQDLLNKERKKTKDLDHTEAEETCVNSYLEFNPNSSLKARLYQKNPDLIKSTFSSEEKNDKEEKDIFEFLDTIDSINDNKNANTKLNTNLNSIINTNLNQNNLNSNQNANINSNQNNISNRMQKLIQETLKNKLIT